MHSQTKLESDQARHGQTWSCTSPNLISLRLLRDSEKQLHNSRVEKEDLSR